MSVVPSGNLTVTAPEVTGDTVHPEALATRNESSPTGTNESPFSKWFVPGSDVG